MYSITCYKNTGFNPVNIPDTPALLESMTVILTQEVDVVQDRWLNEVRVKTTYDDIKDCDYCKIGDVYYAVDDVIMAAVDVAVLSLTMDPLTTVGGPASLIYLDGITERHTTNDDVMWKYNEPDEYMAPAQPLLLESGRIVFDTPGDTENVVAVESTINIQKLIDQFTIQDDGSFTFNGKGLPFYADVEGTSEMVNVPYTEGVSSDGVTAYTIGDTTVKSPNTRQWDVSNKNVNYALGVIRSLAVESSIISQVVYPAGYVTVNESSGGSIITVTGKDQTVESGVKYKSNYANVHNNRIYYGEYNKFGLITASGDRGEFLPEQISYNGETSDDPEGAPSVRSIADPRPTGKPYFRFVNYLNLYGSDINNFWASCLSGLQWSNAPLTYTQASGSYQSRLQFDNSVKMEELDQSYQVKAMKRQFIQGLGDVAASALGAGSDEDKEVTATSIRKGAASLIKGAWDAGWSIANYGYAKKYKRGRYALARENELSQYAVTQSIVAPAVTFPFDANIIRDFAGNNVLVYKYRYTDNDVQRVDKLLTMYGYKDSRALIGAMFNYRTYFDYVRASGVSVGGDLAYNFKTAIAEQLNAGVRVWHVKPDTTYYTSGNPIKTEEEAA